MQNLIHAGVKRAWQRPLALAIRYCNSVLKRPDRQSGFVDLEGHGEPKSRLKQCKEHATAPFHIFPKTFPSSTLQSAYNELGLSVALGVII